MFVPALYHWSPRERLPSIKRSGLMPGKQPFGCTSIGSVHDGEPVLCFSTDPAAAWAYSIGAFRLTGMFDLWQAFLNDSDAVHYRSDYGPRIIEVRVANRIPKSRLVWIGERSV